MTIRVTIRNEEADPEAVIHVVTQELQSIGVEEREVRSLAGGDSCEVHVHQGQKVLIEEVQSGT